jgi:hypothetical protein
MRIAVLCIALAAAGCAQQSPEPAASAATPAASPAGAGTPQDGELEGLPPDAIPLPNDQGRKLWGVKRPDGRALILEQGADGMVSGTGGMLDDLPGIYPGVDFGPLRAE